MDNGVDIDEPDNINKSAFDNIRLKIPENQFLRFIRDKISKLDDEAKSLLSDIKHFNGPDFFVKFDALKTEHNKSAVTHRKIIEMGNKFQNNCAHFLFEAIAKGNDNVVNYLLLDGIDVNRVPNKDPNLDDLNCIHFVDSARSTPLHYAVRLDNEFAILMLLEFGANLMAVNNYRKTPMEKMKLEVMQKFLDATISVDILKSAKNKLKSVRS